MQQAFKSRSNTYLWLAVISITVIAAILRIYRLDALSLWYDEGHSIIAAKTLPFLESFTAIEGSDMPLYFILLHFWMRFFDTDFGIRLLSVIFGLAAIPVTFLVGRTLFNNTAGIIAASFIALSSFHIYYSQDARAYPMFFFITLLSLFMTAKIVKENKTKYWIGYIISASLLMFSHGTAPFYFFALNIFYLLFVLPHDISNLKRWVLSNFIVVLIFSPWLVKYIVVANRLASAVNWATPPTPKTLVWTLVNFTAKNIPPPTTMLKNQLGISLGFELPNVVWSIGFIILFLYSSYIAIRYNKKEILAFIGFLFASISSLYIASIVVTPIFIDRALLPAMIPIPFLVAIPLVFIKEGFHRRVVISMLVITFSVLALSDIYSYKDVKKEDWKGVAYYFSENQKIGDGIIFNDEGGTGKVLFDWYLRGDNKYIRAPKIRLSAIKSKEDVEQHIGNLDWKRIWLIEAHKIFADPNGHVQEWLDRTQKKVFSKRFYLIDIYIYEKAYES